MCALWSRYRVRKKATLPHFLPFSMWLLIHKAQRRDYFCTVFPKEIFSFPLLLKENAENFGHAFKCSCVWFVVERSKCALGHDLPRVPVLYHLSASGAFYVNYIDLLSKRSFGLQFTRAGFKWWPQGETLFNHLSWTLPEFLNLANMLPFM